MNTIFQYNLPDALAGREVVIFGCFKNARNFAMRLLNQNIRFDYFLCPVKGEYVYPHVLNKPVIGFEECRQMENIIIISSKWEMERAKEILCEEDLIQHFVECESLHPAIRDTSSLVVWGTGGRAKKFCEDYGELLDIRYFCDSDEKKAGTNFKGKEVIHFSALDSLPENTTVIIASTFYEDIFAKAVEAHIKESNILILQYKLDEYMKAMGSRLSNFMIFAGSEKNDFMLLSGAGDYFFHKEQVIFELVYNLKNQKIALYGENGIVDELEQKLKLLGMSVSQKIERNTLHENGTIYNLLYFLNQDEILLLTDKPSDEIEVALREMEIKFVWLENYNGYQFFEDKTVKRLVDPNLGHCFDRQKDEYIGFIKYEFIADANSMPIKIVTLGGSTTAAYRVRSQSWSEYLSERLKEQGISHIIYCGGVQAYTVAQELVKLVRDVIVLKPDVVLSYSGANDMGLAKTRDVAPNNPFISYYQTMVFQAVGRMNSHDIHGVSWGLENRMDVFDYWYTMERIMNAICKELGIIFKAFLQPALASKTQCYQNDADVAALYGYLYDSGKMEFCSIGLDDYYSVILEYAKHFRESGKRVHEPWFYDLSDLFDYEEGIYMDDFHVYSRGNHIISNKIYEIVKDDLHRISRCKEYIS